MVHSTRCPGSYPDTLLDAFPTFPFSSHRGVTEQGFPKQTRPPHVLCLPLVCKKNLSFLGLPQIPKNKFNQRSEKMQKERKTVKQDKIIIV